MTATWKITRRAAVAATVLVVGLATSVAPTRAADGDARMTVTDQPGAPGTMLQRFEELTGRPVGDLDKVLAVDTGGRSLGVDQLAALVAGEEVDNVKVIGTMPGGRDILGTTMADLADGTYDGRGDDGTATSALLFANSVPGGREWCLTMCIASGKSVWECIMSRLSTDGQIRTLDIFGDTTVGGTKAALERANGVAVDGPYAVATLVGEGEPSARDIETLLDGGDVESLRRVATMEGPDPEWALADVAEKSGVTYRKTKAHIFTFSLPFLGKLLAVCISQDDGKTWKCSVRPWSGF